jgi:DNA mismatch repair protein MutS2
MTDVLKLLEFSELLSLIGNYVGSPLGRARLQAVAPGQAAAEIEARLRLAAEAREYLRLQRSRDPGPDSRAGRDAPGPNSGPTLPLGFAVFTDTSAVLSKLSVEGTALETPEIMQLLVLAEGASDLRGTLLAAGRRFPELGAVANQIGDFQDLLRNWKGKILPNGELDDRASPQLQRLRREIEKQRTLILSSLKDVMRSLADEGSPQEEIVTIRGDRFVVPVRVQKKGQVKGVVHGSSSSGQTLYMEPLDAIDLNNDLVRWKEEEAREIHRILREMTAALRQRASELAAGADAVSVLDLAFACGRFAQDYDCAIPRFHTGTGPARILLKSARHPLLEALLRPKGMRVVPLSLELDAQRRILVISGPNTGGKTVALKTVGLLALMAMAGLPVPAEDAEFPLFDHVLADIGDSQSIQESLSTFSSHLVNIASMMATASSDSLILLDELGTATDPEEAGALAVAVVDRFRSLGAFALASTHHTALKAYATTTPGVLSANVGFDEQTLAPTYHLEVGRPGNSSGIAIAQRLGLPADVLARARQALSEAHREVEHFVSRLKAEDAAATQLRAQLEERLAAQEKREKEWNETQHRREAERAAQWERQLEELSRSLEERAEQKLRELAAAPKPSRSQEPRKKAEQVAAKFREHARDELRQTVIAHLGGAEAAPAAMGLSIPPRKADVGDTVKLKGFGKTGVVRSKSDNWLEVEVGHLRTRVPFAEVSEVLPAPVHPIAAKPSSIRVRMETTAEGSLSEINVIGETADEARRRVDKFLDNAFLASVSRVRVVHGHGKGILRQALAEMFADHPHVEKFSPAPQEQGGSGATIVELKS